MLSFFKSDDARAPRPAAPWAARLKNGLARTRRELNEKLSALFRAHAGIDDALFQELEEVLLTCDVGVDAARSILTDVRARTKQQGLQSPAEINAALKQALLDLIAPMSRPLDVSGHRPFVIMLAGVNGAGKTTTIGKLAKYFQAQGKSVLFAAGDTFRAAAREQLEVWGQRNNVTVITGQGEDSAAAVFDAVAAAKARGVDVVLADTAGRLPTQRNLMEEIKKVKRVIAKADSGAPHEVLLVLDANTGQNALNQVKAFDAALALTGLVLTKLDGTAKGGVVAGIARMKPLPLRFIGVGEGLEDLRPFNARDFVNAMFDEP